MSVAKSGGGRAPDDNELLHFLVNWGGLLEPIEMPAGCCVADLADHAESAPEAPPEHRLFVFKGLLLHPAARLGASGVRDNSVLHMIVNDDPYKGRPLHIKNIDGEVKTVYCGADFYVEDVKEELSCLPNELPPEKQRLVFAGRELQNQHTLREYNIQKPSVLLSLAQGSTGREIQHFIRSTEPMRDESNVSIHAGIYVYFHSNDSTDGNFWSQMLGGADYSTITQSEFLVKACLGTELPVSGRVTCDPHRNVVAFTPSSPLKPATRYCAIINPVSTKGDGRGAIEHSRARETMHGELRWDFFTEGYEPLRITGVYPRPHSRVSVDTVCIIVSFSGPLHPSCEPEQWLTVRGHELNKPIHDQPSNSLIYTFADAIRPNEICRVRLREQLVRGSRGECLHPPQQDGLLKTSTFRWKFYSATRSIYEDMNLESSGMKHIVDRVSKGMPRGLGPPPAAQGSYELDSGGTRYPDLAARGTAMSGAGDVGNGIADWLNPGNLIGQLTQDGAGSGAADRGRHKEWRF